MRRRGLAAASGVADAYSDGSSVPFAAPVSALEDDAMLLIAPLRRFFALLQKNVLNRRAWATREELRIAIVTWIEKTYHRRRRQAALGRLTPVEYELIMKPTAIQAA